MAARDLDAVIVGAGFAGMYMLHRLRGMGLGVRVLEAGGGVGGTWYWNRYPGARCDIESMEYSYQFSDELQQEWQWSERYAAQPEILRYANHVADRFDLRRDIQFETRVTAARFDDDGGPLADRDRGGRAHRARPSASWRPAACRRPTGRGSRASSGSPGRSTTPAPGRSGGSISRGLRVGVIGTGSSAVQSIPLIAAQAAASLGVPAHAELRRAGAQRAARRRRCRRASRRTMRRCGRKPSRGGPAASIRSTEASALEVERGRARARVPGALGPGRARLHRLVRRSAGRPGGQRHRGRVHPRQDRGDRARPAGGGRRCCRARSSAASGCASTPATTRPSTGRTSRWSTSAGRRSRRSRPAACRVAGQRLRGRCAGARDRLRCDDRGAAADRHPGRRRACRSRASGRPGPRTYLGLAIAGFPNLFTITGPGSPSVLSNMLPSIEQHVDWIADCSATRSRAASGGSRRPSRREDAWVAHVNQVGGRDAVPVLQLLVCRRQCAGQAPGLHALSRLSGLCGEVRAGRGGRLRRGSPSARADQPATEGGNE